MGYVARGCMYCEGECTKECLEELKEVKPKNPAIDMRTNPEGTNVWKELYDRYNQIHKTMTKDKLEELIFISLGRASMCWSEIPKGVFDSTTAAELGREILKAVEEYTKEEAGWSDPIVEHLDREEKESEWQRRRRLEVMKEASMNPNPANYESRDITVEDIHKIHRENQEERELIKKILSDPRNADGFADEEHKQPRYVYEGYTYILNLDLNRIMGVEVPTYAVERKWLMDDLKEAVVSDTPVSSWMEDYKEAYDHLRNSGMFWEFHPTWTGKWEEDKYAFCHDRKFKKK